LSADANKDLLRKHAGLNRHLGFRLFPRASIVVSGRGAEMLSFLVFRRLEFNPGARKGFDNGNPSGKAP
jgi:hypothetical protein